MSFHKLEKYVSNPTQLQGLKYKQPILVSDSKGFTLKNNYHGKFPVECWCQPGATTKLLVDQIETHIEPALRYHKNIVFYLWSGTCDITQKSGKFISLKNPDSEQVVNNLVKHFARAYEVVKCYSPWATLKIIDCPLLSISQWNGSKGHENPDQFKDEDKLATEQITLLNTEIQKLNEVNSHNTIKISRFYFRSRKVKGKSSRHSVNLALNYDGIHPGNLLSLATIRDLFEDVQKECYSLTG